MTDNLPSSLLNEVDAIIRLAKGQYPHVTKVRWGELVKRGRDTPLVNIIINLARAYHELNNKVLLFVALRISECMLSVINDLSMCNFLRVLHKSNKVMTSFDVMFHPLQYKYSIS